MKKKYIILIIIAIMIIIVTARWGIHQIIIIKLKEYSNSGILEYQTQMQEDGYISKENALKKALINDKDYIKQYGLSNVSIELEVDKNNQKYWSVQLT